MILTLCLSLVSFPYLAITTTLIIAPLLSNEIEILQPSDLRERKSTKTKTSLVHPPVWGNLKLIVALQDPIFVPFGARMSSSLLKKVIAYMTSLPQPKASILT